MPFQNAAREAETASQIHPAINNQAWRRQSVGRSAARPASARINLRQVCPVTCASCPEADQWELRLGKSALSVPLLSSDQRGFNGSEVAWDSSTLRQRQPAAPFVSFPWIFISSCTSFYLTNTAGSCSKSRHQQT